MNHINALSVLLSKLSVVLTLVGGVALAQVPSAEYVVLPPPPRFTDQASVRNFIVAKALEHGVSSSKALYIVEKESGFGFRNGKFNPAIEGPEKEGSSWGIWQFWDKNDGFDKACAIDPICSTELAMNWLKAGRENRWSTWRNRGNVKGGWYEDRL